MSTSAFEVRSTLNKGRGLFALRNIPKGGTILVEKVLAFWIYKHRDDNIWMDPDFWAELKMKEETPGSTRFGQIGRLVRQYIEEVAVEGFDVIGELKGAHPEFQDRLVDIFLTNRLRPRSVLACIGLGQHSSLINHACISNSHLSSENDMCSEYRMDVCVKATKDIAAGEEITIGYFELRCEREARRAFTAVYFNFVCSCNMCEAVDPIREAMMMTLRKAYETIHGSTGISLGDTEPWTFLRNAASIERVYRELNVSDRRVAELWLDCAFVAVYHSDAVRARYFFRNAAGWYQMVKRADSKEVEELTSLSDTPTKDRRWGGTDLGASDLSYDPGFDNDGWRRETLGLLFMTDYETPEYRRIAAGADRDLSRNARAQVRILSPYYTAKMEDDAKRTEADIEKAALEAQEQRAKASREALIAEIEREEQEEAAHDANNVSKAIKKAKKRQKRKDGKGAANLQNGKTTIEANTTSRQEDIIHPAQIKAAETIDVGTAANATNDGWEFVTNKKGKQAKGKGKQGETKAEVGAAEKSKDAHSTQDEASTYLSEASSHEAPQNSSLKGCEERSHEIVNGERADNGQGEAEECESPNSGAEEEQGFTDQCTIKADVRAWCSFEAIPGTAAENTHEVDRVGDRAAVAALLQAAPDPIVGRPRAASSSIQILPIELELELELGITGLQDGIRMRQAKIQRLEEEIKDMDDQLGLLRIDLMQPPLLLD